MCPPPPLVVSRDLVKPQFSIPLTRHTLVTVMSYSFLSGSLTARRWVGASGLLSLWGSLQTGCGRYVGDYPCLSPSMSTGVFPLWHQQHLPGISGLWFSGASIQIPCLGLQVYSEQLERSPHSFLGRRFMLNTEHLWGPRSKD